MEVPMPPPPPPPGPPPPPPTPKELQTTKKKLYMAIAEGKKAVEGDHTEARLLLSQRESSFRKNLQWILYNKYVPSLIQDGPQCGLVALWMAAHLRQPERPVDMETIVETALKRGYTAQGEMFSARDMALLAGEVCACESELLVGGMRGDNASTIVAHMCDGKPVLIPYDEDFNHEPCQLGGHRAHWAVASGVLLGVDHVCLGHTQPDPTIPWLHLATSSGSPPPLTATRDVFILAKQGKSLRYQLWHLDTVAQSNGQLKEMDPKRRSDGARYVVPEGGVEAGLAGKVVLLHTKTPTP